MAKTLAEQLERSVDGIRSENWKLRRPFMEAMNSAGGGGVVGGATIGYADSVDSSPRSRGGESWDEPFPAAVAASKLRLMCSYGGRIVPRPTDRSLCYLGGDTRIVVVERHTTLADLSAKLSRNLLGGRSFTLKYQLPNEDLDSLISVTTDEDLDNMVDEYDRIVASTSASGGSGSSRSSRLRLFLFPSKPESSPSSIGSLLDDSKSENWFVDALNGAIGMDGLPRGLSADSSSVNCLLGLEDDSSVHSRSGISGVATGTGGGVLTEQEQLVLPRPDSSGKLARHGLDVQSVPDSPMVETASSFGSTSSAPCLESASHPPPSRRSPGRAAAGWIGRPLLAYEYINGCHHGAAAALDKGLRKRAFSKMRTWVSTIPLPQLSPSPLPESPQLKTLAAKHILTRIGPSKLPLINPSAAASSSTEILLCGCSSES
ncbi:hypothetical protein HPP92_011835 [Vanilla planifolia]|uniref:PB1 domain-containing protein n=1 Tax=Vanilla planifolia TaxID=51239 RepID=A0A835R6I2_VANPL|nr:hypothetical protein HPP92_011835 [Vanilla planifolia]